MPEEFATIPEKEILVRDTRLRYLTPPEMAYLLEHHRNGRHDEFRRSCLGILHSGSRIDSTAELLERYPHFDVGLGKDRQGVKIILHDAPHSAFIDGERLYEFMEAHLCSAAIDLIYHATEVGKPDHPEQITDAVFNILRHARVFETHQSVREQFSRIVCFGGHSLPKNEEYQYSKNVGTELAVRMSEIITGSGPGAMRAAHSGAKRGYTRRQMEEGRRYFGFTAPGIITAEPPNEFVNPLVILPDMEKRIEAFIRASHGCVVLPGGVGTAEELQAVLAVLLHPENRNHVFPLVLTGPESSEELLRGIDAFLRKILGEKVIREKIEVIVNDPEKVARYIATKVRDVLLFRKITDDDEFWNGNLHYDPKLQQPYFPTHEDTKSVRLQNGLPPHELCMELRKFFSAVVYGNVTDRGARLVQEHGPFVFRGDGEIIQALRELLTLFVSQGRMKIAGDYTPSYTLED